MKKNNSNSSRQICFGKIQPHVQHVEKISTWISALLVLVGVIRKEIGHLVCRVVRLHQLYGTPALSFVWVYFVTLCHI